MSRARLIKHLKKNNPKINISEIENVIEIFCNEIEKALKDGSRVELRGFGTFFVKKIIEKHSAKNPRTGELIYIPEKNKVRFKPSKKLKDFINKWKNLKFLLRVTQLI